MQLLSSTYPQGKLVQTMSPQNVQPSNGILGVPPQERHLPPNYVFVDVFIVNDGGYCGRPWDP